MGCADLVPGVSGATLALLTNIYDRLLHALCACDLQALRILRQGKFLVFFRKADGAFLLPLGLGIGTSIFTCAQLIHSLLKHYPIFFWSFFIGLVCATGIDLLKNVPLWRRKKLLLAVCVGLLSAGWLSEQSTHILYQEKTNYVFLFLSAMAAISAMLLPGVSGSVVLVLLGQYERMITALKEVNLLIISVFSCGCIVGLVIFSRMIHWLWRSYRQGLTALLGGLMLGTLGKLWPWKIEDRRVLPYMYEAQTQDAAHIWGACVCALLGAGCVYLLKSRGHDNQSGQEILKI